MTGHSCNAWCEIRPNGSGKLHALLTQWPAGVGVMPDWSEMNKLGPILARLFELEPVGSPMTQAPPATIGVASGQETLAATRIVVWGREP